jgi:AP-1 complex subunit beta-1
MQHNPKEKHKTLQQQVVVLSEAGSVAYDSEKIDNNLLDMLLSQLSTLSSVYHKPPETFVTDTIRQTVFRVTPHVIRQGSQGAEENWGPAGRKYRVFFWL